MSRRGRLVGWFLGACVLLLFARWPTFAPTVWNADEGLTAAIATRILDGGFPYRDGVDLRGPVTYLIYALSFTLSDRYDMTALSVTHYVVLCLTLGLLGGAALRLGGERAVPWTLLFGVFCASIWLPTSDGYAFHTEHAVVLFTSLGACGVLWALDRQQSPPWEALGLIYGLATLAKQPALFDAGAAAGVLALAAAVRAKRGRRVRVALGALARFAAGGASVWALTVAVLAAGGALKDFVFYGFTYGVDYYVAIVPVGERVQRALGLCSRGAILLTPVGATLVAAGGWLCARGAVHRLRRGDPQRAWPQLFLLAWLCTALLGACLSGRDFFHYLVQASAPLTLLAGLAMGSLWGRLVQRGMARWQATLLVAAALCSLPASRWRPIQRDLAAQRVREAMFERVADAVQRHSDPGAPIFMWGFHPEIYAYARRPLATRFSYCCFMVGLVPFENVTDWSSHARWTVPGTFETLLRELDQARPTVIVDWSLPGAADRGFNHFPIARYPRLNGWIQQHYERVAVWPPADGMPFCALLRLRPGS
jgi:hypothetical protein